MLGWATKYLSAASRNGSIAMGLNDSVTGYVIEVSHVTLLIDKHLDTCSIYWSSPTGKLDLFVTFNITITRVLLEDNV